MEYVYSAMLLHSAGKEITEASVKKVLEATGTKTDSSKIKALVSALEGVDIEEVIKQSVVMPTAAPAAKEEEKTEEKKEEVSPEKEEKKAEEAASGLASLFG